MLLHYSAFVSTADGKERAMIYIHSLISIVAFLLMGAFLLNAESKIGKFIGVIDIIIVFLLTLSTLAYSLTSATSFYLEWIKSL